MKIRDFRGKLAPQFNPFEEDYIGEILQVVAVAWMRMSHPELHEIEDRITFRLAGLIMKHPYFADIPYDVVPQYWLIGVNGERLGRLDLRFKHRHSQRDYFAFEAKRLRVSYPGGSFSTEYSTYVGEEGMMPFIEGQYSQGLPAGGMLAYVMDGDSDQAWDGLKQYIERQRTILKLFENCNLVKSHLSKAIAKGVDGTHLGETEHDLQTHRLRLFHLLLPVHTTNSPR